jgi:hypothetical protein
LPKDVTDIIRRIIKAKITMTSTNNLVATAKSVLYCVENAVPGDFVEFGVWRGGHVALAAYIFSTRDPSRLAYGFDTFKGMVGGSEEDIENLTGRTAKALFGNPKRRNAKKLSVSRESVVRNLEKLRVMTNFELIQGDVLETLNEETAPGMVAVARLDTDFFDSTIHELGVVWPKVPLAGLLIVDDYGAWSGSKAAVDVYFKDHYPKPFWHFIDAGSRLTQKL